MLKILRKKNIYIYNQKVNIQINKTPIKKLKYVWRGIKI